MYLYSTVINPSGGIFYNRYFIGLLPFCYLMMAQGILWGWQLAVGRERNREFTALCVGIALVLAVQNGTLLLEELHQEQKILIVVLWVHWQKRVILWKRALSL